MNTFRWFLIVGLITMTLAYTLTPTPTTTRAAPVITDMAEPFAYYPQTGHNIAFAFKQYYEQHGGIDMFGLPLTEVFSDTTAVTIPPAHVDATTPITATGTITTTPEQAAAKLPAGTYTFSDTTGVHGTSHLMVQYFERARFEYHPELPPEYRISLTRIGSLATEKNDDPAFIWRNQMDDPNRHFFPEAGHSLGGAFSNYWQSHGGLALFGYPISEELYEISPLDGNTYLVQYFERARFEYHPEHQGTPYEIQIGHLGRQLLDTHPMAALLKRPTMPIAILGEATTSYAASINERIHNIARATALFDGLVVPPNTVFSFIDTGEFTEENGFVSGYAIVGGRLERVIAGGLCQVSTTMFRAVSNAGLDIVERHAHTYIVNFYENILGFDATVYDPGLDFRWRNDSPGTIYIFTDANTDAATVTFRLYGYDDARNVTYDGPYTSNWVEPGPAIYEVDYSLPSGAINQLVHGRSGVDVTYYRTVTMPDGTTLHDDTFYTHYQPWEDFYVVGPDPEPEPEPTATQKPTTKPRTTPTAKPRTTPTPRKSTRP